MLLLAMMLLGMTLLFSAMTAGVSIAMNLSHGMGLVLTLVGFGLDEATNPRLTSERHWLAYLGGSGGPDGLTPVIADPNPTPADPAADPEASHG